MEKAGILTLFILVLIAASITSLASQSTVNGNIRVVINGYDDGAIVNLYANLTATSNKTIEGGGQLTLIVDSKSEMPDEKHLITNGAINLTAIADALKENKVNANIWLSYKSVKSYGELSLKIVGNYTNINGTLYFNAELTSKGDINNTTVGLQANITIPLKMIGENKAKQLVMMSAFLTPRTVNLYLQQLNMTFIKFKTLQLQVNIDKKEKMVYVNANVVFYVNATEAMLYREKHGATPPIPGGNITSTPGSPPLPPIQTPFNPSRETNTSLTLNATIRTIDNKLTLNAVFHGETVGDLEKAVKESHEKLVKTLKEYNATIPPGLDEIYVAPSPVKLHLLINGTREGKVYVNIVAEDIRLKHVNLTGDEAQKRVTAILLGYLAALQSYLPPTINLSIEINNVQKVEPDAKIRDSVANYLENFMRSIPLHLPTATSTATLTTTYITHTTPVPTTTTKSTTTTTTTHTSVPTTSTTTSTASTTTTTTETTSSTTAASTSPTPTTQTTSTVTSSGGDVWVWIGAATIIVVAVVLVLLYIVLKRR